LGLLKAIVGGTIGLVAGLMTGGVGAPLIGLIGGAFIAQDYDEKSTSKK
jgi:hypothetical protein